MRIKNFGKWEKYLASEESFKEKNFAKKATVSKNKIQLKCGENIIEHHIKEPPKNGFQEQKLVFSADRKWLWFLGYENQKVRLVLLDGVSLEAIDTFYLDFSPYFYSPDLKHWADDLTYRISENLADVILIYLNAGDSFGYIFALQATKKGIADLGGSNLYNTVSSTLDQRLWHASFVAEDCLLIIDDISNMTTFSWPQLKQIGSYSLAWSGDEHIYIDHEVVVIEDVLLVELYNADKHCADSMLAFDPKTLALKGKVRFPSKYARHLGKDLFGNIKGDVWRFIKPVKNKKI